MATAAVSVRATDYHLTALVDDQPVAHAYRTAHGWHVPLRVAAPVRRCGCDGAPDRSVLRVAWKAFATRLGAERALRRMAVGA